MKYYTRTFRLIRGAIAKGDKDTALHMLDELEKKLKKVDFAIVEDPDGIFSDVM